MIRERKLKSEFIPFKQNGNIVDIFWDYKDEVERVYVINEETGEPEFTGEVKETDYCTCMHERYVKIPTLNQVRNTILKGVTHYKTLGRVSELRTIAEGVGASEEQTISFVREMLLKMIERYDSSSDVNQFTIGEYKTWLDKATRVGLRLRFEGEKETGVSETILWDNGVAFPLAVNDAINMLFAIEMYASACYDNTQKHIATVCALETLDELTSYDYTSGYPDKLVF